MAKSKSFFGLRKGSTKSHTFSVLDGQQITKDRVYDVKNPRTVGQMRQRMVMTTVGAAYKYLKAIADHSFEGKSSGMQCMRAFNSTNLNRFKAGASLAGSIAYNEYKDGAINPLPFQLSQGSLPGFAYSFTDDGKLTISLVKEGSDVTTAEGIYDLLGVQRDDLITFCTIVGTAQIKSGIFDYVPASFDIVRLRCDKSGTVASIADAFTISSNNASASLEFKQIANGVTIKSVEADFGAVIQSRKTADSWLRSTAIMTVKESIIAGVKTQNQLATYPVGTELILNNGPMQNDENAGESTPAELLNISPSSWNELVKENSAVSKTFTFDNENGDDVTVNVGSTGLTYVVGQDKKSVTISSASIKKQAVGTATITCGAKKGSISISILIDDNNEAGGEGGGNVGL